MSGRELEDKEHYTYADSLDWGENQRWELFDGIPNGDAWMRRDERTGNWLMAEPGVAHLRVQRELGFQLHAFLRDKTCEVFPAGIEVRLAPEADNRDDTFFVPDIAVVCDKTQLGERGCLGAPTLVMEILSPSTASNDCVYKMNKYRQAGVREYWIVDPDKKLVNICLLEDGFYKTTTCDPAVTPKVAVSTLPGCVIDLAMVFAF